MAQSAFISTPPNATQVLPPGAPFLAPLGMPAPHLQTSISNRVVNFCLPPLHTSYHTQIEYAALVLDCQELANCAEDILKVIFYTFIVKRLEYGDYIG